MRKLIAAVSSVCVSVLLVGCETVQPWQKGNLANPEMAFDSDPLGTRFADQVYHSKEMGSSSATAAGGGGCGCN